MSFLLRRFALGFLREEAGSGGEGGEGGGQPTDFRLNIYDDEGNLSEDFKKSLPEEQKGLIKHFGKYKNTADAMKGLHHMSLRAMKAEVQPLDPNATDEQKVEFNGMVRTALGIPETAADYQLQLPEGVKEENLDKEFVDSLKQFAHENNVTPDAFNKFAPILMQREAAIHQSYAEKDAATVEGGISALDKLWGADAVANKQAAVNAVALVDPDIDPATDPAFMHPTTVRLAHKLAEVTGDDRRPNPTGGGAGAGAGNFREQSLAIVNDKNNPWYDAYHDSKHPNHDAAVKEKQRLSKLAHKAGQV